MMISIVTTLQTRTYTVDAIHDLKKIKGLKCVPYQSKKDHSFCQGDGYLIFVERFSSVSALYQ